MNSRRLIFLGVTVSMAVLSIFNTAGLAEDEPEPSLEGRILLAGGMKPEAASIRGLIVSSKSNEETKRKVESLVEQLASEDFSAREEAQRKLEEMREIPDEVLDKAVQTHDPEVRRRVERLLRLQTEDDLSLPVTIFASLKIIKAKRIGGLSSEILQMVSLTDAPSVRRAAIEALAASANDEDRQKLREALDGSDETVRELVQQWFLLEKDDFAALGPAVDWNNFFDDHLTMGVVEGGQETEFIKGLPPKLLGCFKVGTRTANTMGSVASRSRTAGWLYPKEGLGEIPRVIVEGDNRHYPLWGTWRQVYSRGNITLDENGSLLNCPHTVGDGNIHGSSSVSFLSIPK